MVMRDAHGQDLCEVFCSDEAKVRRMRAQVGEADGLGNLFKAFADETRAKILFCLSREELCVCDVANVLGMSVQAVSHHLRLLRALRLVTYRREGKLAFYALADDHVRMLIEQGLAHVRELR